jgi:16S rRNA processing protein RimM
LARLVRTHGLRGEVGAEILTGFPERLQTLKRVVLWDGGERLREAEVRSCRLTANRGGQALFQFSGVDSIEAAHGMIGWHVQIPLSERLPLGQDEYYVTDLEGCTVLDEDGAVLGIMTHVQELGEKKSGTPVLMVQGAEGEILIPLATEICLRIDPAAREIVVRLPPGLRELNDKENC